MDYCCLYFAVWGREKKKKIFKRNSKGKMLSLLASSDFSCSLSLFHGASWQPPGNIQALLCCCTFANKVGSSGNQTGRKNIAPTSQPVLAPRRYSVWPVGFELIRNYHTIKSFAYAMYNVEGISSPRTIAENMWVELQVAQGIFILSHFRNIKWWINFW